MSEPSNHYFADHSIKLISFILLFFASAGNQMSNFQNFTQKIENKQTFCLLCTAALFIIRKV